MTRPFVTDVTRSTEPANTRPVELPTTDDPPSDGVYLFPASLEQSRYWILDQLEGTSTASNMAIAFRLEGEVRDSVIEQCISDLTLRHEALRTSFQMVDGTLCQVISEAASYSFAVTDLKDTPESQRVAKAEALVLEHSRIQVNLASGPALFVHLIHVSEQSHFLAFTMHHIACDGWSNGILVRDFSELYAAASQGRVSTLPELPFQFADFTVWQQAWLESDASKTALAFWKEHIQHNMPAVDLPTDFPRKAGKSFPGHIESELMSATMHTRLKAYCRTHDATMHQVLLAAFEALIARYANQDEFLLGSTIANRTQPGMENVVGRFAHPQIILADVRNNPTYRELLQRVIEWSAAAYAHQDLPFSRLTEAFQLDQGGPTSQFLQVFFVYQKAFMQPQEAGTLKITPRPSVSGGVNFDMLVSIVERTEGPRLQVEYNTVLFEKKRIRRFIDLYLRILEAVLTDDSVPISDLPLLSAEEHRFVGAADRRRPTEKSARKAVVPFQATSLPQWLDRQAAANATSPAVTAGTTTLTWAELMARSLEFAHYLKGLGVKPGETIALRMESSADTAAAALAVLRVGASVLPVPSGVDVAEWQRIVTELKPALCLGSRASREFVPSVTLFESLGATSPRDHAAADFDYPALGDAAWLGVRVDANGSYETFAATHASALEALVHAAQALNLQQGDSVLVLPARASADAWTDLMLPLLAGAEVVYPDDTDRKHLQSLLDTRQITLAFGALTDWSEIKAAGWQGDRRINIVCRGSRLSPGAQRDLAQLRSRVWSLVSAVAAGGPLGIARLSATQMRHWPVSALPEEELVVLDEWGKPASFGIPGELVVRHAAREVRTGYLAKYSPESGVELVERPQGWVRLHGYRLSLGELEDLLLLHPSVATADAVIQTSVAGERVLAAYLTGKDKQRVSSPTLSQWMKVEGPGHLASAELIAVDSIPRRIDGSPNLDALPKPGEAPAVAAETTEYVAPRDKLETDLVEIWESVLGVQGIGIRTSFFTLGGYSLMMVRLFARINRALSVALPITTIFNAPTIEKLADVIRGRTVYSPLVPVKTTGTKPPFFLIHSYLLYGSLPTALGADYPFYGLRELDGRDQHQTIEARVASYADEIRTIQPHGPYYIGGWCAAGPLAVETARQFAEAGEEVAVVVLFDSWRPGYAGEIASKHGGTPATSLRATLYRKWRFHMIKLAALSRSGKSKYLWDAGVHKIVSLRDRAYLRHWSFAQRLFSKFGLPLPHFMHNISLRTLNLVRQYKALSYPGRITLIRATDAIYIPGADPACGWDAMAEKGVEVLWAPGDHESMFVEPNLKQVGDILRNCIDQAIQPVTLSGVPASGSAN